VRALRKLYVLTLGGLAAGCAAVFQLMREEEVTIPRLIGWLIPLAFFAGVAALLQISFRTLNHPEIKERLGLKPQEETRQS